MNSVVVLSGRLVGASGALDMPNIDQFESVFRAAAKDRFKEAGDDILKVSLVESTEEDAQRLESTARSYLAGLPTHEQIRWTHFDTSVNGLAPLLLHVQNEQPDLLCCFRRSSADADWVPGLGDCVEMLTQATDSPVLLLPHHSTASHRAKPKTVMAVTDHLSGDDSLVSFAARVLPEDARLILAHVEDDAVFERYLEAIGKIAHIDTTRARDSIRARLMKDATDYISSCITVLEARGHRVDSQVLWGHHVAVYQELVRKHDVDLIIMNTKDDDQLAMHGLAYPLAIEFSQTPMLFI